MIKHYTNLCYFTLLSGDTDIALLASNLHISYSIQHSTRTTSVRC